MSLDLIRDLMGKAAGRCAYAEARHVESRDEALSVRAGEVDDFSTTEAEGIGVRVRVGGGWGFAATRDLSAAGAEAALHAALAIAEAQPAGPATPLTPVAPAAGHWSSPYEVDPFDVSLEDKLGLLFAAEAAMRADGGDERIVRSLATLRAWRERKAFASTEGAACTQELVASGAGIGAWASDGSELQVRSYPLRPRRPVRGRGLGARAGARPGRARAARRGRGDRAADGARVPGGRDDARARRRAARAADPRVGRPRARARPDPARRGLVRGDELGRRRTTSARCGSAPST